MVKRNFRNRPKPHLFPPHSQKPHTHTLTHTSRQWGFHGLEQQLGKDGHYNVTISLEPSFGLFLQKAAIFITWIS